MRHKVAKYHFNRDANSRKALFLNLAKSLIEKEQIKTTLERAKALRSVIEPLITRAKIDSVQNRRLIAAELHNDDAAVKKLFAVIAPRYKERAGGYTRVLRAGFRYGDAAEMAIIELLNRDAEAKKSGKGAAAKEDKKDAKAVASDKKAPSAKVAKEVPAKMSLKSAVGAKEVAVKRRATGK